VLRSEKVKKENGLCGIGRRVTIKTIVTNIAFAISTFFSIVLIVEGDDFFGIAILVCLMVIYDYIRGLEKRTGVEKKHRVRGLITYFVTGFACALVYVL
jgi:hypothetical protein